MSAYWHGGIPGLKVGGEILPPSTTKTERNLYRYSSEDHPGVQDPTKVYVTTERNAGKAFAALYPNGALYRVRPVGELSPDPDNPDGTSFECGGAVVEAVYDRRVGIPFSKALRMLGAGVA